MTKRRIKIRKLIPTTIIFIIVICAALVCIFPFIWMIRTSLVNPALINSGSTVLFTTDLTLDGYIAAFTEENGRIWAAYGNSLFIGIVQTLGTLFTSSLAAYAFAKVRFRGAGIVYSVFIATLMLPGQVTMIPLFGMFANVGMIDTFVPLILPGVMINTYGVFMLRSFMVSVPDSILEAAEVDGCGYFRKYVQIMLPLTVPALITLGLFSFIGSWNNYMGQLIYLTYDNHPTIPLFIQSFRGVTTTGVQWNKVMAATTVSIIPIAVIYLACQKYFVQGIATTGLKL